MQNLDIVNEITDSVTVLMLLMLKCVSNVSSDFIPCPSHSLLPLWPGIALSAEGKQQIYDAEKEKEGCILERR
jgi:hypothetical protein